MKLSTLDLLLLVLYALVCIGIGFWSSRSKKDEDYLIAGRRMSYLGFVLAMGITIFILLRLIWRWIKRKNPLYD